jgi:hypothetical protein
MMEAVPEDEQYSGPPAVRPPSEPAPVDPEQVRQFQQFQQFQELMRQQGDAPLLPPAGKPPVWKRVLGSKAVRRLALLLIVVLGLYFAYDYYLGPEESKPASETGGGTNKTNVLHEKTPKRTVRQVYSHVAQNDAKDEKQYEFVCGQFQDGAELQFAHNFETTTCKDAVAKLFAEIDKSKPGWRNDYAEPFPGAELAEVPTGDTARVDTCGLNLEPRLGVFTLRRIENDQWVIIGHQGC